MRPSIRADDAMTINPATYNAAPPNHRGTFTNAGRKSGEPFHKLHSPNHSRTNKLTNKAVGAWTAAPILKHKLITAPLTSPEHNHPE